MAIFVILLEKFLENGLCVRFWYYLIIIILPLWATGFINDNTEKIIVPETHNKGCYMIWARSCENVSYSICEQQRCRLACASAQSDQHLWCSLPRWYSASSFYIWNVKTPAKLVAVAEQTGLSHTWSKISEDTFSRDEDHLIVNWWSLEEFLEYSYCIRFCVFFNSDTAAIVSSSDHGWQLCNK